jgi:tetratricopeptide (TPR) repeat protein
MEGKPLVSILGGRGASKGMIFSLAQLRVPRARMSAKQFAVHILFVFLTANSLICAQKAARSKPTHREQLSPTAREKFVEAGKFMSQGDLESARNSVLDGLKSAPQSSEGYNLLGIIYNQEKQYERAVAAFEQALRLNPGLASTHVNLGNSYFAEQKLDMAAQEFRAALRLDVKNRDANYNLGLVLMAQGHPGQAISFFQHVQPPDASTSLNLLRVYFRGGQTAHGQALAKTISDQAKGDPRIHFSLGLLLASEKQYSAAIHEFELADSLQPGTYEILHDLGQAYLRVQEPARAVEILNRALQLRPDSADTLYLLGQAEFDQRKNAEALELLVRAHKLAPQNTDVIFLMGRISMLQDYFEDAIQVLEEGVKIAPQRPDLHAALGECYFTTGKLDRAAQEFHTLIQLDPSARSYLFMGLSFRHQGKYDEAKQAFNEGIKKDPHFSPCFYNLGFIAHKQGDYVQAEKYLAQALNLNPNYDDALYEMAGVLMAEKKYAEAIPMLRHAAQLLPRPAEAYYKLATAERNLHQAEAAQRDLKIFETLSKDPQPGPYPLQHLFDFVGQRASLPQGGKEAIDVEELRHEVSLHPDRPRDLYLLAEAYLKLARTPEALQTVAQLDQVSGGDFRTTLGVGVLLARYGQYPEAIRHFQMALQADPSSDDAKYNLANAYFRARAYPQALEVMQQVAQPDQQDAAYGELLGDVYLHLGRLEEATRIFKNVLEKNPDNDQYSLSLALVQMRSGDAAAADATLRRGLARIPDSGRLCWGMGLLSVLQGRNEGAAAYLSRTLDFLPEWETGYSALGVFYFETGQIAQARETLDRYNKLFPHGALNVNQIRQVLANAPQAASQSASSKTLSPEERQQFLQTAMLMIDQNP